MTFEEILDQALALLQRRGRLTYRALKRQFQLDDDALEDLKAEIIKGQRLAVDEEGEVLVWTGGASMPPASIASPPPHREAPQVDQRTEDDTPPAEPRTSDAEHRQLTVMFCDLVGSTPLAEQLDPEDLRQVVRTYQQTCAEVIQRFEGHIAQFLGDGLLIYFGWPHAHEDDAQRAVRAGLGILEAMDTLHTRLERNKGLRLAVRVGIHTGLVVVGEMGGRGRQEQLALGEAPNVAARLQELAEPNTVLISAATHRLVQGYFTMAALGSQMLKGVAAPVPVYRILGVSAAQSRLDAAAITGLAPLVGRESEVALLLERWAQSQAGLGQVVLLSGEAGIGKSRLVQVMKAHLAGEPLTRLEWRGSPYHQLSPLYPVITHLHRLLRWRQDEAPDEKLRKLEVVLDELGVSLPEAVPLLAALLSLPVPERYPPLTLTPQRQRQKTLEALLLWLLAEAKRQAVLFIVEDLHWLDPSTLEFLGLLIDQGPMACILTLLTCRPEFQPPWPRRAQLTQLTLSRLPPSQAEVMVAQVAGGKPLPAEVRQQVVAKTDGVPLFVEELTKMVLETGLLQEREDRYELAGPFPALAIPATLHDSLMARLDRLGPVKAVAQLGATLGRTFSYELLRAVSSLDKEMLQRALAELVQAELLYQQGVPPQATYLFKHALIQDAAYQSLLKSRRQQYHQRIAQVLAAQFPELGETQPELLAHHLTEAGSIAQALPYWQRAGQRSIQRSANLEAIAQLTKALELLETLPETPGRTRQELDLHTALGPALIATKGYAALEVEHAYARARELCQHVGETPQLFPVLFGLRLFYQQRAEFHTARELEVQLFHLAQRVQDPALLAVAHQALGATLYWLGELTQARAHLEQGIALYDPQQHRALISGAIQDSGVTCLAFVARVLWLLGYPDQALQRSQDALTRARELSHPFSLAYALGCTAAVHQLRREGQAAQERAEAAMVLSCEQGFALWLALGTFLRGWALAAQGQPAAGLAQLRQGLAAYQAMGTEVAQSYLLALLAEAYVKGGEAEEGLCILAEALAAVHRHGERFYEAELHRLKGQLLRLQVVSDEPEAETCFHQALDIARRQQAKSLELRAAMSLSRLWHQQGRRPEAYELLAPIYGWFTEGFDTADLQEAKALLDEWS
jgi:predicted ATPase/class 3 adenylate cyclase